METVLSAVMKNLSQDMESIQPAANMRMQQSMELCFNKAGGNPDRFAQCVTTSNKKISDIVEPFQYKLLFVSKSAEKCLQSNNEQKCIEEVTATGKSIVQSMIQNLSKI